MADGERACRREAAYDDEDDDADEDDEDEDAESGNERIKAQHCAKSALRSGACESA